MLQSNASNSNVTGINGGITRSSTEGDYQSLEKRITELDSRLLRLASAVSIPGPSAAPETRAGPSPVDRAKAEYKSRRRRERILDIPGLFADPAWDILLDLYIARCEGKRIATSSACIAACVPVTTGLRWITALENDGLIHKVADDCDRRRVFVEISDDAFARLTRYFEAQGH